MPRRRLRRSICGRCESGGASIGCALPCTKGDMNELEEDPGGSGSVADDEGDWVWYIVLVRALPFRNVTEERNTSCAWLRL